MLISTLKSTSSRLATAQLLRSLSTSSPAVSSAAQQAPLTENSHERQSKQRKPHLNKVREEGGETASLLAQAVSSTVQHRDSVASTTSGGFNRQRRPQQQQQGERQPRRQQEQQEGGEGSQGARIRSRAGQLGGQLVSRRKAAGGLYDADASAISAPIAGSEVASSRFNSNPRQQNRRGDDSRGSTSSSPNSRRRPTTTTSAPRTPRAPRKPRAQTKPVDVGASEPTVTPTAPPSKVHYPSLDLASLIAQDLRNNAAALRADIGQGAEAEEGSQKARLEARREVRGDYSRWTAGATVGEGKGKHEVVQRAAGVLATNPSVSREGRDFLVGQLQGLLSNKKK
ncbi:hypothetical protein BCR35DRAFT_303844 [Leucosporidium creatinivorum]|uniref:Uncharacterized protein n=1 Tax=Leucosporidium creatinivorum TaxID=106004 RepID=A0A1Y2FES8_9BASI|nr:hypothetical protein BCR35DRAFT_303844 [Leucosporidium creatinivorum]